MICDTTTDENGDIVLQLPDELCKQMNIGPGTDVKFRVEGDAIIMERKNPLTVYAVETVTSFRNVYFVKAESAEHAADEVVMDEHLGELSYVQHHIAENVSFVRQVSNADIVEIIQQTEQPGMTLEKLESGLWLKNLINEVDYSKT
jgi:bifunctional DNA-binding transcriptional regulator/antitoxin component of YhaV-PrlF toxin-antitoxin module